MSASRRSAALATFAGNAINVLIVSVQAVVLVPLYLEAIGPRLYGAWLGSGDFLVWMQALDLGLPNLMIQRIGAAQGRRDEECVGEYFATSMAVMALIALAVIGFGTALALPLPGWMGLQGAEAHTLSSCFVVGTIAAAINLFNNSVVGFSRGIQRTTFMNVMVIVSSLVGLGVSLGLVLTGWGLWAVALGLASRAGISLLGGALFTVTSLRRGLYRFFRVRRALLREFLVTLPATALGGIGYAVMNQSEAALVAILLRPELAAVLSLTRKALQVAQGLVDMIAFATYGGFAHLVTSDQRHRTLHVHAEIHSLRLSLAIVAASAFMAVNKSLLAVWVGSDQYGGALLTILMATQFVVCGSSFLMNYLYRATGQVMHGSLALVAESLIRVPLMIGLLVWLGLPGGPIASIVSAAIFVLLASRWTVKQVSSFSEPSARVSLWVWLGRAAVFGVGALACVFAPWKSWVYVFVAGFAVAVGGGIALLYVDPALGGIRAWLAPIANRLGVRPAIKG